VLPSTGAITIGKTESVEASDIAIIILESSIAKVAWILDRDNGTYLYQAILRLFSLISRCTSGSGMIGVLSGAQGMGRSLNET
jgi:hypothetical protein